jgi:hypothetical protein
MVKALSVLGIAAVAGVLMAGAGSVQAARERLYARSHVEDDALYIPSGTALRYLTVGFNPVAADLYWIRAIQHYGGTKRRLAAGLPAPGGPDGAYPQLYPLLDITTTLDPRFKIAYRFGAVFLAEAYPNGAGRPDLAIRLLEKGLTVQPDKWEYMEDIGFVHYWYRHDYASAAAAFQKASDAPGAPWWLRSLAATTLAQGGDRESSRMMWRAIRDSAEIDWLRNDAVRRLAQLDALDGLDYLQRLIDEVGRETRRPVTEWPALVRLRRLPGVPMDPAGFAYVIATAGRVALSPASPLAPLPQEPQRLDTPTRQ